MYVSRGFRTSNLSHRKLGVLDRFATVTSEELCLSLTES